MGPEFEKGDGRLRPSLQQRLPGAEAPPEGCSTAPRHAACGGPIPRGPLLIGEGSPHSPKSAQTRPLGGPRFALGHSELLLLLSSVMHAVAMMLLLLHGTTAQEGSYSEITSGLGLSIRAPLCPIAPLEIYLTFP